MDASIIIITKNQKDYLTKTLPVLKNQNYKDEYEIIVVDSGSTDGAREYCLKNKVKVIDMPPENFNFAHSFNKGASFAKGTYLVRLSGDCLPIGSNWLEEMIKPFKNPKVGGVFGKYVLSGKKGFGYPDYWPGWRFPKKFTLYSVKPFWFMGAGILNFSLGKNIWEFAGGCCAIRKSIWQKRPFNESLLAGEDGEYSWFLHIIGYDIAYNPKVEVLHEHKFSIHKSILAGMGLSTWNLVFNKTIWKYWFQKLKGIDPYKDMVYKD